jgi:wyosine [tRNA(Phe)-imidazoG37] synthetase (radical SAM superfamily)
MALPIYLLDISDELESQSEVNYIALVDKPAIQMDWQKFNEAVKVCFNEEKRIISGALMVADMPIYRKDNNFGEYYAVFNAATIEKIAIKFYQKGFQSNVNLMHDDKMIVEGATMFESWIVDRSLGKMPMKGYEDTPDGSWFGSFKINNNEVWQMAKDNLIKGFSVQGLFNYELKTKSTDEQILEQIKMMLSI